MADHLISLVKFVISGYYEYVILLLIAISVFLKLRHKIKGTAWVFFAQAVSALIMVIAATFKLLPEQGSHIMQTALQATGNILCAIFVTSLFVPLLTEYGLVDFVGVFFRPIMRKVFKTPGSSAVIGVSAFLGNYSMGHILAKKMYDESRFTEKEAVIVATGFSTCSIGLMINLVNYLGMMEHWNIYVLSVLIVTFATTILTLRIPPVSRKKDTYAGQGIPESGIEKNRFLSEAFNQGTAKAGSAPTFISSVKDILVRTFPVMCEITSTSIFVIAIAVFVAEYTSLFTWIGYIFMPLLRLFGFSAELASRVVAPISASLFEPVIAGVICEGLELPMVAKWLIAVVPYSSIVFFAGFIPSIWRSGINCKIWEMLVLWLERVIIGIILTIISFYCLSFLQIF